MKNKWIDILLTVAGTIVVIAANVVMAVAIVIAVIVATEVWI